MDIGIMSPLEGSLVLARPPIALPSILFSFLGMCPHSGVTDLFLCDSLIHRGALLNAYCVPGSGSDSGKQQ